MPSRNTVKEYEAGGYYHVYNRGVEKRTIFLDDQDYTVFLGLIKKYLAGEKAARENRHAYVRLDGEIKLLAYCLMPNHFHLLLFQTNADGITRFMRRLATGYAMYFNNRYGRVGALFQGKFKAARINSDGYLQHISRYIHLNPGDYKNWPYSSLVYYRGLRNTPPWLNVSEILGIFGDDTQQYIEFVESYQDSARELSILKWQLANNPEAD